MGTLILVTLVLHLPAIILVVIGASIRKTKPNSAKILYLIALTYTVIGLGICSKLLHV